MWQLVPVATITNMELIMLICTIDVSEEGIYVLKMPLSKWYEYCTIGKIQLRHQQAHLGH
jgi:hypothetical protein